MKKTPILSALLSLPLLVAACTQHRVPPAPGYDGPLPSVEARRILQELRGLRLVDARGGLDPTAPGRVFVVGEFAVVPDAELGKGPAVRLTGATGARLLPLLGDGDVADLYRRLRGRPHASLSGELSLPYRQALGLGDAGATQEQGLRVEHGAGGVVFPAERGEQVRGLGYTDAAGYWTPTAEQVAALERGLRATLEHGLEEPAALNDLARDHPDFEAWLRTEVPQILARLPDYRRQYFGVLDEHGRKRILVNGFAGPAFGGAFTFDDWTTELVAVSDGGFWYWHVEYDVETGTFSNLRSNGYA